MILQNDADDAPPRQAGLAVQLQRPAARPAESRRSEGLRDPPAAVLRSLPEGRARAGVDGEGRPLHRARADGSFRTERPKLALRRVNTYKTGHLTCPSKG